MLFAGFFVQVEGAVFGVFRNPVPVTFNGLGGGLENFFSHIGAHGIDADLDADFACQRPGLVDFMFVMAKDMEEPDDAGAAAGGGRFLLLQLLHVVKDRLQVAADMIGIKRFIADAVAGNEYFVQPGGKQLRNGCRVKGVQVAADRDHHAFAVGIANHGQEVLVQERLAPVVEPDLDQVTGKLIDYFFIVFKGHEAAGSALLIAAGGTQGAAQVTDVAGFNGNSGRRRPEVR